MKKLSAYWSMALVVFFASCQRTDIETDDLKINSELSLSEVERLTTQEECRYVNIPNNLDYKDVPYLGQISVSKDGKFIAGGAYDFNSWNNHHANILRQDGDNISIAAKISAWDIELWALSFTWGGDRNLLAMRHGQSIDMAIYEIRDNGSYTEIPIEGNFTRGYSNDFAWSHDGKYLAVNYNPQTLILKEDGDRFVSIATLYKPNQNVQEFSFSKNSTFLAVPKFRSPYVEIYRKSGDTFTQIQDPVGAPSGGSYGAGAYFSRGGDTEYLAIKHTDWPYVTVYKYTGGDNFVALQDPFYPPLPFSVQDIAFCNDGELMAVTYYGTYPYEGVPFGIYKREGDKWFKLEDPEIYPPYYSLCCAFSPDGDYFYTTYSCDADKFYVYKKTITGGYRIDSVR